jgi:hypothetical protein
MGAARACWMGAMGSATSLSSRAQSRKSRRENDLSPDPIEGFEFEKGEGHFEDDLEYNKM